MKYQVVGKKEVFRILFFVVSILSMMTLFSGPFCSVRAAGFQLFNEMSARGTGLGSAMTSVVDSPEAAWFNPAGVALMERPKVQAGMALIMPSIQLDDTDGDPEMKNMAYPVPNFYMALPVAGRIGLSLAVNLPYGLSTEWDWGWQGQYRAKKTELRCLFFTPGISIRIAHWLAIGAGLQIARADAEMTKAIIDGSAPSLGISWQGLRTKIEGDDAGKGYFLALFTKPAKDVNFGVVFRSHVKFNIDGTARYNDPNLLFQNSDVRLPITLPATLSIGISTTAYENLLLSFDFLWTWWSFYKSLDFYYDKAPLTLGQSGVVSYKKDWDDCYALRFGAEYTLNKYWRLRGSYVFDQSPIDDRYRDPSLPTNDRHLFSIGAGYQFKNFTVDAAYTYLKIEDSHPSPVTSELTGTYEGSAHIVNVSASWIF